MNQTLKYTFFISLFFLQNITAQEDAPQPTYKQRYGVRVGIDLSKPLRSFLDKDYYGIELVGDYRINYKFYAAAELGMEQKITVEDFYSYKTQGQFIRFGIDYNTYGNWYGMENMIYVGGRYGFSLFSQELTSYSIHKDNQYWTENISGTNPNWLRTYGGRSAHWLEVILGMKVELLKNLFAGASIRLGFLVANPYSDFPNYWIPGFNRIREGSRFGASYNYTVTYLIPLYKKEKKKEYPKEKKKQ
ncbi:DUF6048 family protein [Capnocytophaga sp.]|uniref:DUF6048 family protein n=1 Tax=Capnocytophaga sp. TaxID=44737 RepID=UPI0026DB90CA|nr:DUF6048 family protein [Capnocytophaga sp.]MDO5104595.1 DUF6048 family protein [Capnocytophaga sp.]